MIDHSYYYRNIDNDSVVASSIKLTAEHFVELPAVEYDRSVRAKVNEAERAAAATLAENEAARAALADKLGITVEDLSILR